MTAYPARPVQVLRGLAALLTLVLIVVGTPWLLFTVASLPLPDGLPAPDEITTTLTSRDDGTLFIRAVTVIAWGAWLVFTAGVLVEAFAQAGGRQAPRLPGMGSMQRTAAKLVAAVLVTLGVGAPAAMAATPPATAPAATAPPATPPTTAPSAAPSATAPSGVPHTAPPGPGGHTVSPSAEDPTGQPTRDPAPLTQPTGHTRTVHRGDTLWGIAEDEYGDGERYTAIFKASRDVDQPKGMPRLTDPDLIYPGERLVIPKAGERAAPAPPQKNPPKPPHKQPKASPPDTGRPTPPPDTGSPTAPPESESPSSRPSESPSSRPSESGTRAPDRGDARPPSNLPAAPPLPGSASPATPPPATSTPSPTATPSPSSKAASPPSTSSRTPASAAPSSPAPAGTGKANGPGVAASPAPTATASPDPHSPDGDHDESSVSARTVLGYSALAAAGLLGLLALKRLIQQRRRRPGRRIRVPDAMSDSEMDMRAQQEPASVELLDTALRSLSLRLGRTGGTLPALLGAHVTGETVELLLSEQSTPAPPFVTGPSDRVWKLDRDSEALLDPDDLQDVPSPYPSLVTLGFDKAFTHILIDLEAFGAVTLVGTGPHVQEVLSAFALEMAISPWADHILITCVAFGAELPRVLGTGRLRHAETVGEALRDFEARAQEVRDVLADARVGSVRQARTEQVADDSWTPQVILSAAPFGPEEIIRLRALVERDGAANLAAVIAAGGPEAELPGHWQLDATPGATVDIEPFGPVTVQRITADQYRQLVADLSTANDETGVPHPDWQDVPPEPDQNVPDQNPPDSNAPEPKDVRVAGRPLSPEQPDETLIDRAAQVVRDFPSATVSLLQRELRTSYEQASRLMKELVTRGLVGGPAPVPGADLDPDAPDIRILGRVEIGRRDVNDVEPGKRNLLPELAAYLYLNPDRAADEVSRALGGARGPWSPSTRASNMSRLRAWFGRDGEGNVYVPTQGQGRLYTLTGVHCDWDRFQALARRGLARLKTADQDEGVEDLRAALTLVRGQPFAGASPTSYIWAEHLRQEMISAIVDVVHALGVTLTENGDAADARTIITRGLDIEPGSELLFRDLIRAEHRAGNIAGIDHATERLLRNLHDLELEMEPETAELLTRVRPQRQRTGSGHVR